jgi:hypothetical protein
MFTLCSDCLANRERRRSIAMFEAVPDNGIALERREALGPT